MIIFRDGYYYYYYYYYVIYLSTSVAQTVKPQIVTDKLLDKEGRCRSLMEVITWNLQAEMYKSTMRFRIVCGLAYIING
jgi:hypothetical protein